MSAVNVVVNSQRACVLTDSSLYDAAGTIVAFDLKAYAVDSWTGAVTGRGNWWGPTFARELAETFASFDEFLTRSAPMIERAHRAALEAGELVGQTFVEIHAAGWSEHRDQAEAYVLRSPEPFLDTEDPPYVWRSLEDQDGVFHCHHATKRELWQLHRLGAQEGEDWSAGNFDPVRHGIPLMEMQRRRPADARAGEGVAGKHVIGGKLWLTVVDREGVRQGVIHTWEADHPGEPIQPEPLDEASLPKIPPAEWPETFERFERFMERGLVDPDTLKVDMAEVNRRLAAATDAAAGAPASPASSGLWQPPPTKVPTRDQRRAAKAQARKTRLTHV